MRVFPIMAIVTAALLLGWCDDGSDLKPDGTGDGRINGAAADNAMRIAKALFDPEKEGGAK